MNVGDKVKFLFAGEEKEGVVVKVFPKKVYLKVDFPRHPGKIVIRSIAELEGQINKAKKKENKKEKPKEAKEKGEEKEK
ncbi:MAG: hypothetical protein ACPL5I_12825 [Thermodesulfobacteriota bacterium]